MNTTKIIVRIHETETQARDIRWAVSLVDGAFSRCVAYGLTPKQALAYQNAAATALEFANIPYAQEGQFEASAAQDEEKSKSNA